MSEYQPRPPHQGGRGAGWPTQPPASSPGGYQPTVNQPGGYQPTAYGPVAHGQAGVRPPRRRRHRGWIVAAVIIVVLLVIAGGIDQGVRAYAQKQAAARLQTSLSLSSAPSVHIGGWPFLTQAAAHEFKTVDVSGTNETTKSSKLVFDFTATATGVHLNSDYSNATVDHLTAQLLIPFSSLDSQVGDAATISADPGAGKNGIKVSLGPVGGVTGTVEQSGSSAIAVHFNSASGLAGLFGSVAGQTQTFNLPKLGSGVKLTSVNVTSQGIITIFTASNASNSTLEI